MGDQAIVAQFEEVISIEVNKYVQSFAHLVEEKSIHGVKQLLPAFNNVTITYDARLIDYNVLLEKLKEIEKEISIKNEYIGKTIHIPAVFGGEYGPDIKDIMSISGLKYDEVIELLLSKTYYVFMIGFVAGYPYGGHIDERLITKRRANPRLKVKKGTIQVVDKQIGQMTMDTPTGWHLVGWSPMEIFNPYKKPPGLIQAGDNMKFEPITAEEAESWNKERQREWDQKWNTVLV